MDGEAIMSPTSNHSPSQLPAPAEYPSGRNLPVSWDAYRAPGLPPEMEAAPPSVPLSHYLWILRWHWWKILLFVIAAVTATVVVSSRIRPAYEATATVDIDRQTPSGIIGQEAVRTVTNDSEQFL